MNAIALPRLILDYDRLNTYTHWPYGTIISPKHLSKMGFAYTGMQTSVVCIYCGFSDNTICNNDNPLCEHLRRVPYCEHLRKRAEVASKLLCHSKMEPLHPVYTDLLSRKLSFSSWPLQIAQTGTAMAKAGFYYSDRNDEVSRETHLKQHAAKLRILMLFLRRFSFKVTCFHCNTRLSGWLIDDDPLTRHLEANVLCTYALLQRPLSEIPIESAGTTRETFV